MNRIAVLLVVVAVSVRGLGEEPGRTNSLAMKRFDTQVAPLLAVRCLECHSGLRPKGSLDLSQRAAAFQGGESGAVLVAGASEKSSLWQRVAAGEMPPGHPLNDAEKKVLREWINEGAVWGEGSIDPLRYSSDRRAGYDWWSLQPLKETKPPEMKNNSWPRNGIDLFVLKKLEDMGLRPSSAAEPRTLVRRLYFDLIGLPPSFEEIENFAADPSEKAYGELVDSLLASPHYGERWGRHWLDVARFGESDGFERNNPRKNFWPYRDRVIQMLNDDVPYDRFARLQLAGDFLEAGPSGAAAAGFLVAGVHNTVVGSSERMKKLARQDELEEVIGTIGQTFLGLTINCARCHDHKFDPISTTEYYRLISTIDGMNHGELDFEDELAKKDLPDFNARMAAIRQSLAEIDRNARQTVLAKRKEGTGEPAAAMVPSPPLPYGSWEFDGDLRDGVGKLHGTAMGNARMENGALVLDGKNSYVQTEPLDRNIGEKTLEAWVQLKHVKQAGAGVISLESLDGRTFDAIVFGEKEPRRWMAGSNFFTRTQLFFGEEDEEVAKQPSHIAIVYRDDGTIVAYRNGRPYGQPYKSKLESFEAGKTHLVFGLRHSPAGGNRMLEGRIFRANFYDRALSADEIGMSSTRGVGYVSPAELVGAMNAETKTRRAKLDQELASLQVRRSNFETSKKRKIYTVKGTNPTVPMRVHVRGDVTEYGPEVTPGGIRAVQGVSAEFGLTHKSTDKERRQRLAEWITDKSNALFTRTIVNRIWHYHFGVGIVETPNDLGFNGGRPSHPEMLEWLSGQFQQNGYRLKGLHRLIVMSATYRQDSGLNDAAFEKDAGNRLLWRYSPRRLDGESLRDAMLRISAALNLERGGPGYEDVSIVFNNGTTYFDPIDTESPASLKRTIYRFSPRGGTSPVLDAFDCPDPSAATPRRSSTTTPLQALSLLNNAFVLRMADRTAARIQEEVGNVGERQIVRTWQRILGRGPSDDEVRRASQLVRQGGLKTLCRALLNCNEFVYVE